MTDFSGWDPSPRVHVMDVGEVVSFEWCFRLEGACGSEEEGLCGSHDRRSRIGDPTEFKDSEAGAGVA